MEQVYLKKPVFWTDCDVWQYLSALVWWSPLTQVYFCMKGNSLKIFKTSHILLKMLAPEKLCKVSFRLAVKLLQLVQWVAINCKIFQYFSLTVTPVNLQQPATSLNEPKDLNFKKSEIRWMINSLNMWLFKTIFLIIVSLNLALSLVISCYCW